MRATKVLRRGAIATMAAASTVVVASPAAYAGQNAYPSVPGARAIFEAHGEHLYACDTRSGGEYVVARLFVGGKVVGWVRDRNGASAGCGHQNLSIAEGRKVLVEINNVPYGGGKSNIRRQWAVA